MNMNNTAATLLALMKGVGLLPTTSVSGKQFNYIQIHNPFFFTIDIRQRTIINA